MVLVVLVAAVTDDEALAGGDGCAAVSALVSDTKTKLAPVSEDDLVPFVGANDSSVDVNKVLRKQSAMFCKQGSKQRTGPPMLF